MYILHEELHWVVTIVKVYIDIFKDICLRVIILLAIGGLEALQEFPTEHSSVIVSAYLATIVLPLLLGSMMLAVNRNHQEESPGTLKKDQDMALHPQSVISESTYFTKWHQNEQRGDQEVYKRKFPWKKLKKAFGKDKMLPIQYTHFQSQNLRFKQSTKSYFKQQCCFCQWLTRQLQQGSKAFLAKKVFLLLVYL